MCATGHPDHQCCCRVYGSMVARQRDVWMQLPAPARDALPCGWRLSVPVEASALHARWWQLETWLRSLAYVGLCTRFGASWLSEIPRRQLLGARGRGAAGLMPSRMLS